MGQPATFTISTPNTDTFHWTKNNTAIALANSTLSFTSIALADSGTYQCLLKNECGDSLLKSFYVKVGQILPIGFALTGKVQNNNAVLQWQDLAANNVNYYELQRSADGRNFAPLTKVLATNQTAYRFTDVGAFASPSPSERDGVRFFYRLKQTGKDGKENLSNIVELNTEHSTLNFALSPNPTKDKLTVNLANYEGKATLTIVDVKGAVLLTKTVGNGNNTIHLRNWAAGEYVVVITDKTGRSESKKVVVVE